MSIRYEEKVLTVEDDIWNMMKEAPHVRAEKYAIAALTDSVEALHKALKKGFFLKLQTLTVENFS